MIRLVDEWGGWRWAALKNGFQDAVAYRVEFLFEILGYAAVPAAVQMVLWYALYRVGGAERVAGFTYEQMIHYTLVSVLFSQVRGGNHDFELQEMIRSGQLSNYLLRPVGVVEFVWIRGVAPKLLISGVCLLIGMILCPIIGMNPLRLLAAMAMALVGNVIHYLIGAALATAAFYWEEAYSILMVKNMVVDLLCGELIPLTLFPPAMQWIWKSTPFYFYVFGPVQYSLGHWSHQEFFYQFGLCGIWLLGSALLVRLTWGLGMRRYLSLGG